MILKMRTKQPSPQFGIAKNTPNSNGYITVDLGTTGAVEVGEINRDWTITWGQPTGPPPPFFCPIHKEIGEEVVLITDANGKTHYYCKKCVLEKLGGAEAFRREDELTERDFEEKG